MKTEKVGVMNKKIKAQAAVENLTLITAMLSLLIPIVLLLLFFSSNAQEEIKKNAKDIILTKIKQEIEHLYTICGEKEVEKKIFINVEIEEIRLESM